MGYLLRGLRVASYLSAALGTLFLCGATINDALLFYGVRFLFMGVVGIGATSLLRDRYLEGDEEEEYNAILPTQEIIPQVKPPNFIQSIMFRWAVLSPVEKAFVTPVLFFFVIIGIGILTLIIATIIEFVFAVM